MANTTPYDCGFANKSWVEMYEDEHADNKAEKREYVAGGVDDSVERSTSSLPVTGRSPVKNIETWERSVSIVIEREDEGDTLDLFANEDTVMGLSSPAKTSTPPKLFASYANILKNASPENGGNPERLGNSDLGNQGSGNRKMVKREIQKDFLQEDLSLTSHLDVFHMQSPCKINEADRCITADSKTGQIETSFPRIDEWPLTASGKKKSPWTPNQGRELRSGKRRIPFKQVDSTQSTGQRATDKCSDDVLMPSPSKIIRSFGNNAESSTRNFGESRKRHRENYSSPSNRHKGNFMSPANKHRDSFSSPLSKTRASTSSAPNTPGDSTSSPSNRSQTEYEIETDPGILSRRQKQIYYGKNTVGYEQYTAEVPRDKREKKHPKTPPRHRKYSRRAWDGLIKNWRRRLHYWDPVSEGGGNPDLLEDMNDSELAEYSVNYGDCSLPNSVPSTPQQDSKRRRDKGNDDSSFDYEFNNDFYVSDSKCEGEGEDEEDCKPLE